MSQTQKNTNREELRDQLWSLERDEKVAQAARDFATVDMLRGLRAKVKTALSTTTWMASTEGRRLCHAQR